MAIFGRTKTNQNPTSIVASAARVKLTVKSEAERIRKIRSRSEVWQADAWTYYDAIGEVNFAYNFIGWAMSRLRLFIGQRPAPNEDPEEITNNALATQALERLKAPGAGHAELLRTFGLNLGIPGECWLIGTHERTETPETWRVRSVEEVKLTSSGVAPKLVGGADGLSEDLQLDDDDFFLRVWIPHPNRMAEPDSPLKALTDPCEELLVLSRVVRAAGHSRIPAGLLLLASELDLPAPDPAEASAGGGSDPLGPFLKLLTTALTTPIADGDDVSSIVPMLLRVPGDKIEKAVQRVDLSREIDGEIDKRTERALTRLKQGLPVPPEVVTGKADANHWSAWNITDDEWKALEPMAITICDALTTGYLHPYLVSGGKPVRAPRENQPDGPASELMIWYDPAGVLVRPNRSQDAKDAHEMIIISDKAARREMAFEESDAPDSEEVARREARRRPIARPEDGAGDEPPDEPGPPEEPEEDDGDTENARQAAGPPPGDRLELLARRLASIDRTLRERVVTAADAALARVLQSAGGRIKSKAQRNKSITAALAGVDRPEDRAAALGPSLLASIGLAERDLIAGGFADLRQRFETWVEQAQGQALKLVPDLTDVERDEVAAQQAVDRAEAGRWLENRMEELALDRLYDPSPSAPEVGEFDATVAVPFGIIREAIARAGGAAGADAQVRTAALGDVVNTVLGLATGWLMRALFGRKGIQTEGYVWTYGDYPRTTPFEPHEVLDGTEFVNFDDPELVNPEGFPAYAYYLPGDHDGCRCDVEPVLIETAAEAAA